MTAAGAYKMAGKDDEADKIAKDAGKNLGWDKGKFK